MKLQLDAFKGTLQENDSGSLSPETSSSMENFAPPIPFSILMIYYCINCVSID